MHAWLLTSTRTDPMLWVTQESTEFCVSSDEKLPWPAWLTHLQYIQVWECYLCVVVIFKFLLKINQTGIQLWLSWTKTQCSHSTWPTQVCLVWIYIARLWSCWKVYIVPCSCQGLSSNKVYSQSDMLAVHVLVMLIIDTPDPRNPRVADPQGGLGFSVWLWTSVTTPLFCTASPASPCTVFI